MSEYAVSSYPDFANLKSWVDMETDFLFNFILFVRVDRILTYAWQEFG